DRTPELRGEVTVTEAVRISPHVAYHGRPGSLDDQRSSFAALDVSAGLIDYAGDDAGQGVGTRARFQRRGARQWGEDVAAGFGLPPGVNNGTLFSPYIFVIPHPRFRI